MTLHYILMFVCIFTLLWILRQNRKNGYRNICGSIKYLENKTAIVTGGTNGIGLEVARDFAKRGARVIIACPFQDEGKNAEKIIRVESGNNKVEFQLLDLRSFKSVREFAFNVLKTEKRLDILVNNAGVGGGVCDDYVTEDGLNLIMQINYYGHFLLTLLLLPLLRETGTPAEPARILNNSSLMHRWISSCHLKYINLDVGGHSSIIRGCIYAISKLYLALFTRELTKQVHGNIVVNSVDPGAVGTNIFYAHGFVTGFILSNLFYIFSKTPFEGAQTAIHVAVHTKGEDVKGEYFNHRRVDIPSAKAKDDRLSAKVWKYSIKIVKLTEAELEKGLNNNVLD